MRKTTLAVLLFMLTLVISALCQAEPKTTTELTGSVQQTEEMRHKAMLTLMRHAMERAARLLELANMPAPLEWMVGRSLLVVDPVSVNQIYAYKVGGVEVDTNFGKVELHLICGSKFMGYDIREIYVYPERPKNHWTIDFFVPAHPKTGPAHYTQESVEVSWSDSAP